MQRLAESDCTMRSLTKGNLSNGHGTARISQANEAHFVQAFHESSPSRLFGFLEEFLGTPETIYRSRDAAIDGCLEEDLHDFLFATAVVQRSLQVQFHFVRPIKRSQHGQVNKAAGLTW
jgi:hypothetical protein